MPTVVQFLVERLSNAGIQHVFGVPGDYVNGILQKVTVHPGMSLVTTTNDAGAAYAADAYARVRGAGCVVANYNIGAFKIVNAVAGASAERSPLVVVSGAPGIKELSDNNVFKHMRRTFACQKAVFENLCCDSAVLTDPSEAGYKIDRALEALRFYKQPVYIELPRDIADKPLAYDVYRQGTPESPKSDPENLNEALEEVLAWVGKAKNPVILAGVEVARYELGVQLQKFAERTNIPIATTLLSKSVINEKHPLFLGLYNGSSSQPGVQEAVEQSDCVLMFGVMQGDAALSYMPLDMTRRNVVSCTVEELRIKNHAFKRVQFHDFIEAFLRSPVVRKEQPQIKLSKDKRVFQVQRDSRITTARLFEEMDSVLDANSLIVSDTGNSLFGAAQLMVHHNHSFLGHAIYSSVGSAIPASLGASLARPTCRPFVLVGDAAFQASMNELGTIVAQGLKPIVLILNNRGYGVDRLTNQSPFNTIPEWKYHKVVEMLGGYGTEVYTEGEFDDALAVAVKSGRLHVINVNLEPDDQSPLVRAMTGVKKL